MNREELSRYSRNILLDEVGREGQERLKASRVLVIGAGGLGSPLLLYLTAAGVGHLSCVESDRVDLTNLQRQILFATEDIGESKARRAESRLQSLNPHVAFHFIEERLRPENGLDIVSDVDLVLDGSDNFPTRFLVNDLCQVRSIPLISGGILQFYGMLMGMIPGKTPCYRCLFEHLPEPGSVPSCSSAGVLGAVAGVVGSLMAAEALKFLTGMSETIMGRMLRIDQQLMEYRLTNLPQNAECPACGHVKKGSSSFDPANPDYFEADCGAPFSLESLSS